ncbi:MAG TPA: c-type cytochrome [Methylophaga aminisulfidivorans]|uniref:C-type cytochrome n=1 Tax=Methylophaga aminisulfidivorans TaxID=230105 RepID=A0A7C1ZS50_9GAMM|nr:c-type cytochrome [Methylophaga aminisulfidivorans]
MFLVSFILLFSLTTTVTANEANSTTRQLLQIAEYVNVDYSSAVKDGLVISEAEYSEMLEFSALAVEKSHQLDGGEAVLRAAVALEKAIKNKANPDQIEPITVTMRNELMALSPAVSLPNELLTTKQVQSLYQQNCAACHGAKGQGDGELAATLEPTPTDFSDKSRAMNRSIVGLYDAITNGIEGTAMVALSHLTEQERWSLAFYAGSIAFQTTTNSPATVPVGMTTQDFISNSPNVLLQKFPTTDETNLSKLRANPDVLFSADDPLTMAKQQLSASYDSYIAKEYKKAQSEAVSAYLDGFELAENALDAYNPELRLSIEKSMMAFRQLAGQVDKEAELKAMLEQSKTQLSQAQDILSTDTLSNSTLFSASLIILLREGIEAILVVLALATVLVKTERRDALKYLHFGWTSALVLGVATWWAAQNLVTISGASREIMEGMGALLAAVILFYVGFWMHSKTNASAWQAYIKENIHRHLSTGTLWGIAGLSFIAVYREVFETVLFYQALISQSAPTQLSSISSGFIVAAIALAIIAWVMVKFSLRLPIRTFFSFTTYLMLILSFILMGKAIAALQEADIVNISALPVDLQFTWLGIHPTWEGVIAQLLILIVSVIILMGIWPSRRKLNA